MTSRIGIIAGSGNLPLKLIRACQREHKEFFIIAIEGQTDINAVTSLPHEWVKLGETSKTISALKAQNVNEVVMAGSVRRPSLAELRPDMRTVRFFKELGFSALGDDRLLTHVAKELAKDGLRVIGAHEIEPEILSPEGLLTKKEICPEHQADIEYGIKTVKQLGLLDIGQAAVVQQGVVLGVEGVEGTDNLIKRCKKFRRKGLGAVLVKGIKPQQDRRLDMPTIGPRTVRTAHKAGIEGIAVEAGASIILDREETVALANRLGVFLFGFESTKA